MAFEDRMEARRRAMESATTIALQQQQKELEALQTIHEQNRNHPIFKEMRELANSIELQQALLAYYIAFKNRQGGPEISIIDTYDHSLKHKEDDPFGQVNISMPISDPVEYSGGDADPITIYDDLVVTIRAFSKLRSPGEIRIFSTVSRERTDGSGGKYSSYNWDDILNNIADRIIRK